MIVHSLANTLTDNCAVRVEWDEWDAPTDKDIRCFAIGAAAAHNPGMQARSGCIHVYTLNGRVLDAGEDTLDVNGAEVWVTIQQP